MYWHEPKAPEIVLRRSSQPITVSRETLLRLQDLAELGDVDAIIHETGALQGDHPEATSFLKTLQQLSQNCQLDDIESLLVHYISVQ